jgi:hypothetical protein
MVYFDHEKKQARLYLDAPEMLEKLQKKENKLTELKAQRQLR